MVCNKCNDTHRVWNSEREYEVWCQYCPVPCDSCRTDGRGAYCQNTPCSCACHNKSSTTWGGGTSSGIAIMEQLEQELDKARRALMQATTAVEGLRAELDAAQAFHNLAVRERDFERVLVTRLRGALSGLLEAVYKVPTECENDCQPGIQVHVGRCKALIEACKTADATLTSTPS